MKNAINWFEIPTRDMDKAVSFYEKLRFVPNLHHNHAGGKRRRTTSMRFDAFAPMLPDWTRLMPLMRPESPVEPVILRKKPEVA